MIGYHYTSYDNWLQIRKNGLKLAPITKPELFPYLLTHTVDGVWIWKQALRKRDELGTLLWVLSTKKSWRIAKLEVQYEREDLLTFFDELIWAERVITMSHNGTLGDYQYHPGNPDAHIITRPLPADRVRCLQTFSFGNILKNSEQKSKNNRGEKIYQKSS